MPLASMRACADEGEGPQLVRFGVFSVAHRGRNLHSASLRVNMRPLDNLSKHFWIYDLRFMNYNPSVANFEFIEGQITL